VRLSTIETIEAEGLFGRDPMDFPFTFLPVYVRFEQSKPSSKSQTRIIFLQDEGLSASAPMRLYHNRIMRLGQWLSPPMRDGQQLPVSEEFRFIEAANRFLVHEGLCDRLIQPANHALFQTAPEESQKCRFGTFLLPLEGRTEEEVFASFHANHRRDIRRAVRDGAKVRFGQEEIPAFHLVYQKTMERSGLKSTSLLEHQAMASALGPDHLTCAVAYDTDGKPLGGVFGLHTREGFYYFRGASAARPSIPGAVRLATWEMIRLCMRRGIKQYNFVGARLSDVSDSKLGHIQDFKSRFGTTLREGILWKMDLRPSRTRVYDAMNHIRTGYRWLKRGKVISFPDVIDQESSRERGMQSDILSRGESSSA